MLPCQKQSVFIGAGLILPRDLHARVTAVMTAMIVSSPDSCVLLFCLSSNRALTLGMAVRRADHVVHHESVSILRPQVHRVLKIRHPFGLGIQPRFGIGCNVILFVGYQPGEVIATYSTYRCGWWVIHWQRPLPSP